MPDSVLTVVCMAYVPYLDFWNVCLALYSEHALGMCAPSVCLTLVSTFCTPDSIVFWRECLVCVISMCSGHVYLALCIRFRPWGVYRLLFLLWVPGMTLVCVPACQAATAGLSCSPPAVCWCCLFANVFLARVSALPCLEGGPVSVRPVFPAPCVGPELCPCDMLPVMCTSCFPVCVHSLGTSKCAHCCVPSLVLVHGIVYMAPSSLDSHLLGAPVWGCPPSAEQDSGPILVLAPRGSLQPLHLYELMFLLAHLCRKPPEFSLSEGSTPTSKTPHSCGESQQGKAPQAGIVSWAWRSWRGRRPCRAAIQA